MIPWTVEGVQTFLRLFGNKRIKQALHFCNPTSLHIDDILLVLIILTRELVENQVRVQEYTKGDTR